MAKIRRARGYTSWNLDEKGRVKDVFVSWNRFDPEHREHRGGAYMREWLEDDDKDPAYLYGYLRSCGFASAEEETKALEELGKMKHCKWARQIAKAMRKATR